MNLSRVIKNILFLLVAIFSGLVLVVITAGVTSGSGELNPLNDAVDQFVVHFRTPVLTSIMLAITNLGSPFVLALAAIILSIVLLLHRDTYDTLLYMVSIALAVVVFVVMKNSLGIARPSESLVAELSGSSYPSGHATVATAFFFVTGYTFWGSLRSWSSRVTLLTFCLAGGVLVSLSRIYLGAHFALDVLAGTALGLLSVSFTILIFNLFLSEREWWRRQVRSL